MIWMTGANVVWMTGNTCKASQQLASESRCLETRPRPCAMALMTCLLWYRPATQALRNGSVLRARPAHQLCGTVAHERTHGHACRWLKCSLMMAQAEAPR